MVSTATAGTPLPPVGSSAESGPASWGSGPDQRGDMKIGIVIGSIRETRRGEAVARWVMEAATTRPDAAFELIDLRDFHVPLFTAPTNPAVADRRYDSPEVTRWSAAIDACDGFVFVTAEYNHSVPGVFKNAVDSLGPEWSAKSVAFVSYGADGGIRAVEHWRQIVANFQMMDVRAQVALSIFTEFTADGEFTPAARRPLELERMLDHLAQATRLSRVGRGRAE